MQRQEIALCSLYQHIRGAMTQSVIIQPYRFPSLPQAITSTAYRTRHSSSRPNLQGQESKKKKKKAPVARPSLTGRHHFRAEVPTIIAQRPRYSSL